MWLKRAMLPKIQLPHIPLWALIRQYAATRVLFCTSIICCLKLLVSIQYTTAIITIIRAPTENFKHNSISAHMQCTPNLNVYIIT